MARHDAQSRASEAWRDKAQVVDLRRGGPGPDVVELAAVVRSGEGRFVHRRLRCSAEELARLAPRLNASDPATLAFDGDPPEARWIEDQPFDTPDQALAAAQTRQPSAHPALWNDLDDATFASHLAMDVKWFKADYGFGGWTGVLVGFGVFLVLVAPLEYLARLADEQHFNTDPAVQDYVPNWLAALIVAALAGIFSLTVLQFLRYFREQGSSPTRVYHQLRGAPPPKPGRHRAPTDG